MTPVEAVFHAHAENQKLQALLIRLDAAVRSQNLDVIRLAAREAGSAASRLETALFDVAVVAGEISCDQWDKAFLASRDLKPAPVDQTSPMLDAAPRWMPPTYRDLPRTPRELPHLRTELAWFAKMLPRCAPEYAGWCEAEIKALTETIEALEQCNA